MRAVLSSSTSRTILSRRAALWSHPAFLRNYVRQTRSANWPLQQTRARARHPARRPWMSQRGAEPGLERAFKPRHDSGAGIVVGYWRGYRWGYWSYREIERAFQYSTPKGSRDLRGVDVDIASALCSAPCLHDCSLPSHARSAY